MPGQPPVPTAVDTNVELDPAVAPNPSLPEPTSNLTYTTAAHVISDVQPDDSTEKAQGYQALQVPSVPPAVPFIAPHRHGLYRHNIWDVAFCQEYSNLQYRPVSSRNDTLCLCRTFSDKTLENVCGGLGTVPVRAGAGPSL